MFEHNCELTKTFKSVKQVRVTGFQRASNVTALWHCEGPGLIWNVIPHTGPFIWLTYDPKVLWKPDVSLSRWPPEKIYPCDNLVASFDKPREYLLSHTFVTQQPNTNSHTSFFFVVFLFSRSFSLSLSHTVSQTRSKAHVTQKSSVI